MTQRRTGATPGRTASKTWPNLWGWRADLSKWYGSTVLPIKQDHFLDIDILHTLGIARHNKVDSDNVENPLRYPPLL